MGSLIIPTCNNSSKYQGDKKKGSFIKKIIILIRMQ